uniref:DM2 domain-containing protein n=1 Tax=viral metagenome TaxID=1070528 RepID=A0A6C0LNR6_9ZZZZ
MPSPPSKKQPVSVSPVQVVATSSPADTLTKKKKPVATPTVLSTVPAPATVATPVVPVAATAVTAASETVPASAATAASSTAPATAASDAVAPDNVLSSIIDKVNTLSAAIKDIQANLKVLSKEYDKQQKIIEKAQKKRLNAKNSPSGFAKPNKISDELCDFIGVPHGTEKSRTDITRLINAYVKEHNLNKPENKRFILPDDKLKKILNVGDSEEINYFILQRLISHHFPASASKTTAKPVAATATAK